MMKISLLLVLLSSVFVSGCASVTQERITVALNRCPVLKQYTREQMIQAANELRTLPTESQIAAMFSDYSKLRDACRVAERKLKEANK